MDSRERLIERAQAGEELTLGEAAILLCLGRSTVHRLVQAGEIAYTETPGGHRRLDPEDLLRLYRQRQTKHGGKDTG